MTIAILLCTGAAGCATTGEPEAPEGRLVTLTAGALSAHGVLDVQLAPEDTALFDQSTGAIDFDRVVLHVNDAIIPMGDVAHQMDSAGLSVPATFPMTFSRVQAPRTGVERLKISMCAGFVSGDNLPGGGFYYYYPCWTF